MLYVDTRNIVKVILPLFNLHVEGRSGNSWLLSCSTHIRPDLHFPQLNWVDGLKHGPHDSPSSLNSSLVPLSADIKNRF